jgi:hypothetical protein
MTGRLLTRRLPAVLIILLAALGSTPAGAAGDWVQADVEAIREHVGGLLAELSYSGALSADEVNELRAELTRVHSELDALADRLAREEPAPRADRPGGWRAYDEVSISSDPPGAVFSGWQPKVKLDLEFGEYGVIEVGVIKNGYIAKCEVFGAYNGGVNARLESRSTGDIIVHVDDDLGSHEFLIENGGLGPVFVRGRPEDGAATPDYLRPGVPAGDWYQSYRELVEARQLDESPDMEWLIGQYLADDYDDSQLRLLGERLASLPADAYLDRLGWLDYETAGELRTMDVPDPRLNPAGFVHFAARLHQCFATERFWELSLP